MEQVKSVDDDMTRRVQQVNVLYHICIRGSNEILEFTV